MQETQQLGQCSDAPPPLYKKSLVILHAKKARVGWDGLRVERLCAMLVDKRRQVCEGRFIADSPVCLTADKGEIRYIVGLS